MASAFASRNGLRPSGTTFAPAPAGRCVRPAAPAPAADPRRGRREVRQPHASKSLASSASPSAIRSASEDPPAGGTAKRTFMPHAPGGQFSQTATRTHPSRACLSARRDEYGRGEDEPGVWGGVRPTRPTGCCENRRMQTPHEWALDDGYVVSTDPARLDIDRIHRFLSGAYWSPGIPRAVVDRAIQNSLPFGLYAASGEQAGFARAITDRATYAYLADVYVEAPTVAAASDDSSSLACSGIPSSKAFVDGRWRQPTRTGSMSGSASDPPRKPAYICSSSAPPQSSGQHPRSTRTSNRRLAPVTRGRFLGTR